ncbi:MAG: hypothetical protein EGR99_09135 [Faecalibacterium sp.]|nr:hypothetical protein [Faecalibacterium sp.]
MSFSATGPPVKRPIGKIRRFSRLANINDIPLKMPRAQRRAVQIVPHRSFSAKNRQKDSFFCLLPV